MKLFRRYAKHTLSPLYEEIVLIEADQLHLCAIQSYSEEKE